MGSLPGRLFLAAVAAILLAACGGPAPAVPPAYVGDWQGTNMRLQIGADGNVVYERKESGKSVSVNAPIKRFEGDNIVVGMGPITTTFVVSRTPQNVDGVWKMTVDGVELTLHGGRSGDRTA
jgi:hypothetical protein